MDLARINFLENLSKENTEQSSVIQVLSYPLLKFTAVLIKVQDKKSIFLKHIIVRLLLANEMSVYKNEC